MIKRSIENQNPFVMSENDLTDELARLEGLLNSGELPAHLGQRLLDVRSNLKKLQALKGSEA